MCRKHTSDNICNSLYIHILILYAILIHTFVSFLTVHKHLILIAVVNLLLYLQKTNKLILAIYIVFIVRLMYPVALYYIYFIVYAFILSRK